MTRQRFRRKIRPQCVACNNGYEKNTLKPNTTLFNRKVKLKKWYPSQN